MIVPSYYSEFHCIADRCRHSCCKGWEIDVDEDKLAVYLKDPSPFGERFRQNIAADPPHFVLSEGERCPFLNERGLCDIILEKGEDWLCQICHNHPRYYNEWPGRTEAGLGLCCEEAARIILSQEKPFTLDNDGSVIDDPDAKALYALRETMIDAVFSAKTVSDAEKAVLEAAGTELPQRSLSAWADFYLSLERLDEDWTEILQKLQSIEFPSKLPNDKAFRNLLAYFLYRHMPEAMDDGDIPTKAAFAVLSCRILAAAQTLGGDLIELARLYSSEIEYSLENLSALYDELWELL